MLRISPRTRLFAQYGALAVIVFDLVASLISRHTGIPYVQFAVGSFLLYLCAGLITGYAIGILASMVVAVALWLADTTLGWALSWIVGPGRPEPGVYNAAGDVIIAYVSILIGFGLVCTTGGVVGRLARFVRDRMRRAASSVAQ